MEVFGSNILWNNEGIFKQARFDHQRVKHGKPNLLVKPFQYSIQGEDTLAKEIDYDANPSFSVEMDYKDISRNKKQFGLIPFRSL